MKCALVKLKVLTLIGYVGEPIPQPKPKIEQRQKRIKKRDLKKPGDGNWWKHFRHPYRTPYVPLNFGKPF